MRPGGSVIATIGVSLLFLAGVVYWLLFAESGVVLVPASCEEARHARVAAFGTVTGVRGIGWNGGYGVPEGSLTQVRIDEVLKGSLPPVIYVQQRTGDAWARGPWADFTMSESLKPTDSNTFLGSCCLDLGEQTMVVIPGGSNHVRMQSVVWFRRTDKWHVERISFPYGNGPRELLGVYRACL